MSHDRHIHIEECKSYGIKVEYLENLKGIIDKKEDCVDIQDFVLTVHHSYMHTFSHSDAVKIVENHKGNSMIISG